MLLEHLLSVCKEEDNSTAITKVINSESASYRPTLTDTLVLDAVPTVNSFNSVTSDAVARAIAGASGEVPQVTENDNGKILTATYDELGPAVSWEEAPSGIPDMTGKDGKILGAVDNSGTMEAQWIDKPATLTGSSSINITNNVVSVSHDSTLSTGGESTVSGSVSVSGSSDNADASSTTYDYTYAYVNGVQLGDNLASAARSGSTVSLELSATNTSGCFTLSPNTPSKTITDPSSPSWSGKAACFFIYDKRDVSKCIMLPNSYTHPLSDMFGGYYYIAINSTTKNVSLDFSDVVTFGGASLSDVDGTNWYLGFGALTTNESCPTTTTAAWGSLVGQTNNTLTLTYSASIVINTPLKVTNPVPSFAAVDAGKVLAVNSGATSVEWTNFTQIEVVASMPASPTSGVLYIVTGA